MTPDLMEQGAKRLNILDKPQTSGKTEAEFADMYGMDLKLVSNVLARVRADQAAKTAVPT